MNDLILLALGFGIGAGVMYVQHTVWKVQVYNYHIKQLEYAKEMNRATYDVLKNAQFFARKYQQIIDDATRN